MTRLLQFVAVTAVTFLVPIAVSVPASAAFKCEVGYTGPDSENMCISEVEYKCSVENTNKVTIKNTNNQTVASGDVSVDGNGNGGGAVSGSASNNNEANFNVTVTNGNTCLAKAVVPATEEPQPGKGESPAPTQPTQKAAPKALPVTSGSELPIALVSLGGLGVVVGAAIASRRFLL